MNIKEILNIEKDLNNLLNLQDCPADITEQFNVLFNNKYYKKSYDWLDKNKTIPLHDSFVVNLSQKKEINEYNISFDLDYVSIYSGEEKIGYMKKSKFKIKSKESLRELNKKCILNFLIDEENKEIAFLYLNKTKRKVISIKYSKVEFVKGKEII